MSTHSVSLGGATVGRSITRIIGCIRPSFAWRYAVLGYFSPLIRFSAAPGYPVSTTAAGNVRFAYRSWKYSGGRYT